MIVGKMCMDPDGGEPFKSFKEYDSTSTDAQKELETAKKERADGCDVDEECKYGIILWDSETSRTKMSKKCFGIHKTKHIIHYRLSGINIMNIAYYVIIKKAFENKYNLFFHI